MTVRRPWKTNDTLTDIQFDYKKYNVYVKVGKKGEEKVLGTQVVDFANFKAAEITAGAFAGIAAGSLALGMTAASLLM